MNVLVLAHALPTRISPRIANPIVTFLSSLSNSTSGVLTGLIVHEMYNVKIISLETPFTHEFNGVLCVSCMPYIIALVFGQS